MDPRLATSRSYAASRIRKLPVSVYTTLGDLKMPFASAAWRTEGTKALLSMAEFHQRLDWPISGEAAERQVGVPSSTPKYFTTLSETDTLGAKLSRVGINAELPP